MKRRKLRLRKWVRQLLSIVLVIAMVTAVMPQVDGGVIQVSAAEPAAPSAPEWTGTTIYGNGTPLLIEESGGMVEICNYVNNTKGTTIASLAAAEALNYTIVGGYKDRDLTGSVSITMNSGSLKAIYGSISGNQVNGDVSITMNGGTVTDVNVSDGYVDGSSVKVLQTAGTITNLSVIPYLGTSADINADIRGKVTNVNNASASGGLVGAVHYNVAGEVGNLVGVPAGYDSVASLAMDISGDISQNIYANLNGKIAGNVTINMNSAAANNVYGVNGTIGGNTNIHLTDTTVRNTLSILGDNTSSANVAGSASIKLEGDCSVKDVNTALTAASEISDLKVYLSGTPEIESINLTGTSDGMVHLNSAIRNSQPIKLVCAGSAVEDGKKVITASSTEFLNTSKFTVTNEDSSVTYDLYLVGEDIIIGYSATNTITASVTGNGFITPNGATIINKGDSEQYSISPGNGAIIADVFVDGESVGPVTSYLFENVVKDHTIEAQFAAATINKIDIISQPTKMSYDEGETLDLTGLAAKFYYNDGTDKVLTWDYFQSNNIGISVTNGTLLKGSHDGQSIIVMFNGVQAATDPLQVKAKLYTITMSPTALDFGTIAEGYTEDNEDTEYKRPSARTVMITNSGNQDVTLLQPAAIEGYDIGALDKEVLAPGESASITVQPKLDLKCNTYNQTFKVETQQGTSAQASLSLVVAPDTDAPTGQITIASHKWNSLLNTITFGKFFKETQQVTVKAEDVGSGIDTVHYYISNQAMTVAELNALSNSNWTVYDEPFNIEADNKYVIYVKILDKSGNRTYVSSDGVVLDGTAPIVVGIDNGEIYIGENEDFEQQFTVTDANLDYVTVNGKKISPIEEGSNIYSLKPAKGEQVVCVSDYAENQRFISVIVAIDRIPIVNGLEEGKTYCEQVVFVPEQDDIISVTSNGEEIVPDSEGAYIISSADDIQEIIVTNQAGESTTVHIQVNPKHIWILKTADRESTCTQMGIGNYVCAGCGEQKKDVIPLIGHNYSDEWTVDIEPGGKTPGEKSHHCINCDFRKDITEIPATGIGAVKVQIHEGEGVPKTTLQNSDESIVANLLTKEEQALFNTGDDAVIDITVTVSDRALSDTEKENIRKFLKEQNKTPQQIDTLLSSMHSYDFKGYKKIGNNEPVEIEDIYTKLIFHMDLSELLAEGSTSGSNGSDSAAGDINNGGTSVNGGVSGSEGDTSAAGNNTTANKEYVVIMMDENGNLVEVVAQPGDELYDLILASGDLSTYMVMYMDKIQKQQNQSQTGKSPQTGDSTPVSWLFALMLFSGTGFVWAGNNKKKRAKNN